MSKFKEWEYFRDSVERLMRLKKLRSQAELAKLAKVSATRLSFWMTGRDAPSGRSLTKLATALGVTRGELLQAPSPKASEERPPVVWVPVRGKVWASPFRLESGHATRWIRGQPGETEWYALEVEGESMMPAFKPGQFIVCRPVGLDLTLDDIQSYTPRDVVARYHLKDAIVFHDGYTNLKRIRIDAKGGPEYELWMTSLNEDKTQFPDVKLHRGDAWILQSIVERTVERPEFMP